MSTTKLDISMKSFKEFISEEVKLRVDNPGGDWLKRHKENADENYHKRKGIGGGLTGTFNKNLNLPVSKLKDVPGYYDEHKFRNDPKAVKSEMLEKEVGHPSNFDSKKHPIFICVSHRGEPQVLEGNHRLGYAHRHGISHIHAEVRYFNGGEKAEGDFHPDKLKALHKEE